MFTIFFLRTKRKGRGGGYYEMALCFVHKKTMRRMDRHVLINNYSQLGYGLSRL